jgi:prepilin-type N-terminal cleavage/methylation domain-containing protein
MQGTLDRLRERRELFEDEGGFTLIELLIVIVILAILAAIVVIAVQNLSGSTARASCEWDAQTVDHAVQAFRTQTGTYPNSVAELEAPAGSVTLSDSTKNLGPWLHNPPTNGTNYAVELDGNVTSPNPNQYKVAGIVPGTTSNAGAGGAQVDILSKWDQAHGVWTISTPYTPPTNTESAACSNVTG